MNENVKLVDIQVLAHKKYALRNVAFDLKKKNGKWQRHHWEVYEHGNAATVLLYNRHKRSIVLVRQFRIIPYLAGDSTGMLLETCAGLLEGEDVKAGMIREIEEETGYYIKDITQVYKAFTSAGALGEKLYFFIGEYDENQKRSKGGGVEDEHEEVEVVEMPFDDAVAMLREGTIYDVKTIVLLQYALLHKLFDE